ncbi:hypothetical protein M3Y94_00789800 [Aphelenchoides besseyi]|nr:hypothetical protein M3Y94_00789800 [Aphelenchoides besseyi]KAI6232437.1 hypothetical protein M3Y95_00485800 [Aphelenchoides besseyi]
MSPNSPQIDEGKSHHSSLLALFHRKKRQTSAPVAPQSSQHIKPPPSPFTIAQRFRLHRDRRQTNHPMKTSQSQTLHTSKPKRSTKHPPKETLTRSKALSADNICDLDPEILTDALLALGEQPIVARSTPKHAVITETARDVEERRFRHCIFEPAVYDKMLSDSLLVCDLLTASLDELAIEIRAQSPRVTRKSPLSPTSIPTRSPVSPSLFPIR